MICYELKKLISKELGLGSCTDQKHLQGTYDSFYVRKVDESVLGIGKSVRTINIKGIDGMGTTEKIEVDILIIFMKFKGSVWRQFCLVLFFSVIILTFPSILIPIVLLIYDR